MLYNFAYVQVVLYSCVHTALQQHELPCNVPGIQTIIYRWDGRWEMLQAGAEPYNVAGLQMVQPWDSKTNYVLVYQVHGAGITYSYVARTCSRTMCPMAGILWKIYSQADVLLLRVCTSGFLFMSTYRLAASRVAVQRTRHTHYHIVYRGYGRWEMPQAIAEPYHVAGLQRVQPWDAKTNYALVYQVPGYIT